MNFNIYKLNHFARIIEFLLYQKNEKLTNPQLVSLLNSNGISSLSGNTWTEDALKQLKKRLMNPFENAKTSVVQMALYLISTGKLSFENYLLLQSKRYEDKIAFQQRQLKKGNI
ncbi:hypothetical protein H8K32_02440 [Undibacterium jejuense]|uniref:Uncharacterized protein n=1 Tax=Undibacterium jejuense TaxID=1344949 RepID=A0A923HF80_9BURK|nr:hypothetical protein [Undibacterium jejuense]MBC3860945.1 hypothetical protein [Undibacterium jejuense]